MATAVLQRPQPAQKTRARQSGLELLRILCMLFIIADHYAGQSGGAVYDTLPHALLYALLGAGSRMGCSIFVMIGAWFLCEQPFKTRRVLNLWLSLWLYTVPLTILCYFVPGSEVGLGTLRWAIFPVSTKQLWFVAAYVVLLLLSPVLNLVLHTASRQSLRGMLILFGALLVGYSTLFAEDGVFSDVLWTFLYEYLLVGYLRRYPDNRLSGAGSACCHCPDGSARGGTLAWHRRQTHAVSGILPHGTLCRAQPAVRPGVLFLFQKSGRAQSARRQCGGFSHAGRLHHPSDPGGHGPAVERDLPCGGSPRFGRIRAVRHFQCVCRLHGN